MKYTKELNDFEKALSLNAEQSNRIRNVIQEAYHQEWHIAGPNIDQINNLVAPHLKTPEEAFYAATIIISDVIEAQKRQSR